MFKIFIAGNWKCNPESREEAKELFEAIKKGIKAKGVEVVICPSFVHLPILVPKPYTLNPKIGAQNCFYENKGAYTGEVSPTMLKELGVGYVILGHSERRKYFNETDEIINKKIKKALETGLKVIFCIGETQEQRDKGEKFNVLEKQIKLGLKDTTNYSLQTTNLSIAYEPVWAIGTGNNCSVQETKESIDFIKKFAPNTRVLYGGSVKSENSGEYIKKAGADGLLVGGASLDPEEFIKIVKSAE